MKNINMFCTKNYHLKIDLNFFKIYLIVCCFSFVSISPTAGQTNLALGKQTQQSSTGFNGESSRAVDGNTSGQWGGNSVTHTSVEAKAWWQIDLGDIYEIDKIVIWNRQDCCWERLQNFFIFTSKTPFVKTGNVTRGDGLLKGPFSPWSEGMKNFTIDVKSDDPLKEARYIRLQLRQNNEDRALSLAEVQVFGTKTQNSDPCATNYVTLPQILSTSKLSKGDKLKKGQGLSSPNGNYVFRIKQDGQPVIEKVVTEKCGNQDMLKVLEEVWKMPIFKANWGAQTETAFSLQDDCNGCFKSTENYFWCITGGNDENAGILHKCDHLELTNDGRLVLLDANNEELWASKMGDKTLLNSFFNTNGGKDKFNQHYIDAVTASINAQSKIRGGNYQGAKTILDKIWKDYPAGDDKWKYSGAGAHQTVVGQPTAYNGLRMMTDIVNFHIANPQPYDKQHTIKMKVVLVGSSKGIMPKNPTEMAGGKGTEITTTLDPRVKENNHQRVFEGMDVFNRYITASTDGKLKVEMEIVDLPKVCVETHVVYKGFGQKRHNTGIKEYDPIWEALSDEVEDDTDWWWFIYPSHVPGTGNNNIAKLEEFKEFSYVSGGLLTIGKTPVLVCDDLFLIRKQPYLGGGDYTKLEMLTYMPQFVQHEFFHHFYNIFPSFPTEPKGLEPTNHDWGDRDFWPQDFKGYCEADFYQESMHKRIKKVTKDPLHMRLRSRKEVPPANISSQITMQKVLGNYALEKVVNDWNVGKVIQKEGKYFWRNNANIEWEMTLDVSALKLKSKNPNRKDYDILLKQNENTGEFLPVVKGLLYEGSWQVLLKQ